MKEWIEKLKIYFADPQHRKVGIITGIASALIIVILIAVRVMNGPSSNLVYIDTVSSPIATRISNMNFDAPYYKKRIEYKTKAFYKQHEYKTKWLEYKKPTKSYKAFIDIVMESAQYGLNPEHYALENIDQEVKKLYDNRDRTHDEVADMDIKISGYFFLFTTHFIEGRIRTAGYGDFIWKKHAPEENDIKLLLENSSGKLTDIIEQLHPPHEQYDKLRKALQQYRSFDQSNPFKKVALNSANIKPGDNHPSIPLIRRRLFLTDIDPYPIQDDSIKYDEHLLDGVKQFQQRHGLPEDGIIDAKTLAYLNQSFSEKADLIELNLERLRWLPRKYGDDYITINVPEYMLRVYQNQKKKLEMKVVLGSEYTATPIFSDTLEYIVFSPTWTVPPGIMKQEIIPNLQEDPEHYDPARFTIYKKGEKIDPEDEDWKDKDLDPADYKLVESPGENNALGLVKFIMPNDLSIYLHDSPATHLFKEDKRAFSHGCIRLEDPIAMAEYLLRDQSEWKRNKIQDAMQGIEPKTVHLKKKYHVEIEYRTVWVDAEGIVHFREDLYGHDKRQLAQLKRL